jgi:hypothetical protein
MNNKRGGEDMKTKKNIMALLIVCSFLLLSWLPCQAEKACYQIHHGQLRLLLPPYTACKSFEKLINLQGITDPNPLPNFEGDLCWSILETEDQEGPTSDPVPYISKLTIEYSGQKYYLVQGIVEIADDNPVILNGIAVLSGDKLYISLSETQDNILDQKRFAGNYQIQLDQSTLNGSLWGIRTRFKPLTREFDPRYDAGTVTLITCP